MIFSFFTNLSTGAPESGLTAKVAFTLADYGPEAEPVVPVRPPLNFVVYGPRSKVKVFPLTEVMAIDQIPFAPVHSLSFGLRLTPEDAFS
jgi:hypothetical protein